MITQMENGILPGGQSIPWVEDQRFQIFSPLRTADPMGGATGTS